MTNNYNNQSNNGINSATVVVDDDDGPNTFVDRKILKPDDDEVKDEQKLSS